MALFILSTAKYCIIKVESFAFRLQAKLSIGLIECTAIKQL